MRNAKRTLIQSAATAIGVALGMAIVSRKQIISALKARFA